MEIKPYDLVVIGGGPAGASGANVAAAAGRRVALIEKAAELGGAGINTGTIPSKTLRESALALSGWRSRRLFGVDLSLRREATVPDLMYHEQRVTAEERTQLESRLESHHVARFRGAASFVDSHTICVTGPDGAKTFLRGDYILASAAPRRPPGRRRTRRSTASRRRERPQRMSACADLIE